MGRNLIESFPARMRELRESKGLTRDELAVAANTSSHSIAKLEQGVRAPSLELAWRVAKALRCSLDDLVKPASSGVSHADIPVKKGRGRPRKAK
jgi:transcriptional regulator with XRE-family HTH domain